MHEELTHSLTNAISPGFKIQILLEACERVTSDFLGRWFYRGTPKLMTEQWRSNLLMAENLNCDASVYLPSSLSMSEGSLDTLGVSMVRERLSSSLSVIARARAAEISRQAGRERDS